MNKNISQINTKDCYGCGACYNICPSNAIEMIENQEGFISPIIDIKKCTNCGMCSNVCPVLKIQKNQNFKQKYYIGFNKNITTRTTSSSGGIFTLLANWILKQNGFVCGAKFNENAQLFHILTNKKEDLQSLSGSKYLQSNINTTYKEIKQKLDEEFPILFCGTPCQVNGLLNFLQKKYDNLYTIDIACHGVPSQKSFNEYLEEKFQKGQKYSLINFRDKRNGYSISSFTIKDLNGNEIFCGDFGEPYLKGFSRNLFLRECCGSCKYTTIKRTGDITIADFWNVRTFYPTSDYEKGISSFVVNNEKGQKLFDAIKNELQHLKKVKYEIIKQPCFERPLSTHKNRALYFSLKDTPFSEKISKCLNDKNVGIINFTDENGNYGALFVAYSMKKIIEKLGYNAYNINFIRNSGANINSKFEDFRKKYLNLTQPCYTIENLANIQSHFSHIIAGGDQVFNGFWPEYTLQFVQNRINMFSYAASLGPHNISFYLRRRKRIQEILSRFDNLSVREDSAVKILKEIGINTQSHIDSVLLLDEKDYDEIIKNDNELNLKEKKYIACALWNFNDIKKLPFYDELSKEYDFVDVLKRGDTKPSFGNFLNLIKNADYIIANSYHGLVFSILFKKQFAAIRLNDMRDDRIITMFSKLGIKKNRLFFDTSQVSKDILFEKIDYEFVMKNLEIERHISYEYLRNALNTQPKVKNYSDAIGKGIITDIKFLNKFSFLKCIRKNNKILVLLFGHIPIFRIIQTRREIKLFGFIPLFKY